MRRRELFCQAYVVDLNATRAAIAAGYSKKTADQAGSRLLTNVKVKDRMTELTEEKSKAFGLSADRVLKELMFMGFANMEDYIRISKEGDAYIDLMKLTREQASAIQEITVEDYTEGRGENEREIKRTKLKLHGRCRPLELLGKYQKMFIDRVEHEGLEGLAELIAAGRKRASGVKA